MLRIILISLLCPLFFSFCGSNPKQKSDLIIYNAVIYTVDSAFNVCQALCVKDGKILDIGSNEAILKKYDAPVINNANGHCILPGLIDAHCHFLAYGQGLQEVNLVGTKSFQEVIEKVIAFASKNTLNSDRINQKISNDKNTTATEWIIGRGWDQNDWDDKKFPDKKQLDSLFPDIAVYLTRIDGHAVLVNTKALQLAGINGTTKVNGGEILTSAGQPTGILIDNAVDLAASVIPEYNKKQLTSALIKAQENCLKSGLTTVDDAGLIKDRIDLIDELQKTGELKIKVYAMLSDNASNYESFINKGPYKTNRLTVCAFKFYADGALGSRGACLHDDYSDKKNWKGFLLSNQVHFEEKARLLAAKGFQMNTHCIGDSAYHIILNAYKKAGITKANRWRIEHAQVVAPKDMQASDNIIPSVQPTHATSDMYWAEERLGKQRVKTAYAYKELLKKCGIVALGTDFPVEDISPFKTFYAAVFRKDAKGFPQSGFQKENALSREETLKGMTIWAAYSNFEEKEKGSIETGKWADFIIIDTDIMTCKPESILNTKVLSTYINGENVFSLKTN